MPTNELIFNELVTNLLIEKGAQGGNGIANVLAPINDLGEGQLTSSYFKRKRIKSSAPVDTKRAPGDKIKRGRNRGKELTSISLIDHALEGSIPKELTSNSNEAQLLRERISKARELTLQIQNDWENEVHEMSWGSNAADFDAKFGTERTLTPTTKWNAAGSEIGKTVAEGKKAVLERCGHNPNVAVMPLDLFNNIVFDDNELREVVKYTSNEGNPVSLVHLESYFGIERIVVPQWLKDATPQADDETKTLKWDGDHMGLFYVDDTQGRDVDTFAKTFTTTVDGIPFMGVRSGVDNSSKSDLVDVSAYWAVESVDLDCGFWLTDLLS